MSAFHNIMSLGEHRKSNPHPANLNYNTVGLLTHTLATVWTLSCI